MSKPLWPRLRRVAAWGWGRVRRGWQRQADPSRGTEEALLFSIEENPRPRDTGVFSIHCCGKPLAQAAGIHLNTGDLEPVLSLLRTNSADLRTCKHHAIRFRNVSLGLQRRILAELDDLQVPHKPA